MNDEAGHFEKELFSVISKVINGNVPLDEMILSLENILRTLYEMKEIENDL